jgi:phage-related protein
MGKGLSNNQKAEIAKNEVKTRILVTITLNNAAHEVVRILENDSIGSFTHNGDVYISAMVKRSKIESRMEGGPQKCNITISNINRVYSQILVAEAENGDVLTNSRCVIQEVIFYDNEDVFLLDDSSELLFEDDKGIYLEAFDSVIDGAVAIFDGYVNNIQLTETEFSFDVERVLGGYSTLSPNTTYDVNCQWIFKDCRCQYAGAEAVCDKTFSACQARGNETRFGGYPSIPAELVIRG